VIGEFADFCARMVRRYAPASRPALSLNGAATRPVLTSTP
jgi:hypothetical protein